MPHSQLAHRWLAPRWLALHLAVVLLVAAFGWLGWWQLGKWLEPDPGGRVITDLPPVALGELTNPDRLVDADLAGRRVSVTGQYDAGEQLFVAEQQHAGRTGVHVLTPLITADGAAVVVNRGWVSDPGAAAAAVPDGLVTVTGRLRPSESVRAGSVGGGLPPGQVALINSAELVNLLPYQRLYDGYITLTGQRPPQVEGPVPLPDHPARASRGALLNLSYAAQWWLFAAAAVFFWGRLLRSATAPPE